MPLKTFLVNKFRPKKFRLNGLIPSSQLPRKRQLCQSFRNHVIYRAEQLPPKVDLRPEMTPVEDQSRIGSCAANCLAGAYEYLTKKANGRNTDVSRLFIYYNARVKDQQSPNVTDSGCTMTGAIEALEEMGTCLESIWPYDISRVNARPNDQAYQEAKSHTITEALQLDINLHEMKSCLAQGFPFAFGLKLYSSFDQAAKTGVVPMPNTWENNRQSHGSHALLAVGYSDQSQAFIVRNSWGEEWGDQGYCYIPYDYVANQNYCFDVWTVHKLATNDFGQDHWDFYDVVNYTRNNKNNDQNGDIIDSYDDDNISNNEPERNGNHWNHHQAQRDFFNNYPDNNNNHHHHHHHHHRHRHHDMFERYPDPNNFYNNQYRNENDFFNFPDSNRFMNNSPNFFHNQFSPRRHYGSSYGYSSPFNDFYNPFF